MYEYSIVYFKVIIQRYTTQMNTHFVNQSFSTSQNFPLPSSPPPPSPNPQFLQFQKQTPPLQFARTRPMQESNRVMYKSTIQPTTTSYQPTTGFGLGKLESMGRVIKQQIDNSSQKIENIPVYQPQLPRPLAFKLQRPERVKMASSVIFSNKSHEQQIQFPFTGSVKAGDFTEPRGLQSLMSKAKVVKQQVEVPQTLSERRNREIFQIKKQLDNLNHNIQKNNTNNQPNFQERTQNPNGTFSNTTRNQFQPSFQNNAHNQNIPIKQIVFQSNPTNRNLKEASLSEKVNVVVPKAETIDLKIDNFSGKVNQIKTEQLQGMFKKKAPFPNSNQNNGKTDQNLLKMLGINLKSPTSEQPLRKIPSNIQPQKQMSKTNGFVLPITQTSNRKSEPNFESMKPSKEKETMKKKFAKQDFKIGKKMGKGQFGEVMLVQHKQTGFICGMKVMSKKQIKLQKYENQIARQLSIQFYLNHRNVGPLYGYFQDQENIYLLVQFCTDGQLLEMIRKNRRMEQPDVSPIIRQICEGLDYIHREEIIHRDIKPQNILFNFGTVKISDFGWAVHSGNGLRKTVSGSPLYYSPEIVLENSYDQKIDLWAIGMMTYQCLLGKIPFRIYSQLDLNRIVQDQIKFPDYVDVTDEAKDFILKIMKKKPEQRMEMKQILRHPFITKYSRQKKIGPQILDQIKKTINL